MEHSIVQQQADELACLDSMFPGEDELVIDPYIRAMYESAASAPLMDELMDLPRLELVLRFKELAIDKVVPELKLRYPLKYPLVAPEFELSCPTLTRQERQTIVERLVSVAESMVGDVATFELYQAAQEILQEIQAEAIVNLPPPPEIRPILNPVLGRRAIYFHHIIATSKRRVVLEWAKELGLGGFSKIGWPGVIIAEGQEPCVAEYVRRLQHLRWKQMVVRGEQVESNSNAPRLLPVPFTELSDMSELAQECKNAGVSELFLTTMKIYR